MGERGIRWIVGAIASVAVLASCSSGGSETDEPAPRSTPTVSPTQAPPASGYVALGDSFTAGPGLDRQRADAGFCQRSELNWPTLLAASLPIDDFTDLSCAGATTADLLSTVDSPALGAGTDLVTIGVGGNEGGLFATLLTACAGDSTACSGFVADRMRPILDRTTAAIVSLVEVVRDKAPDATVVLVGYLRIMPEAGTCPAVGIAPADVTSVVRAEEALEDAQIEAADRSGVEFVPLRPASRGHDACAGAQAWTNGQIVSDADGIVFHPRSAGMVAVADAVADAVTDEMGR